MLLENERKHKENNVVDTRPEVHHNSDRSHFVVLKVPDDLRVILKSESLVFSVNKRLPEPR